MSRLLVSTFFRMLRKIVFWILIISMFTYGVFVNKKVLQKGSKKVSTFNTQ